MHFRRALPADIEELVRLRIAAMENARPGGVIPAELVEATRSFLVTRLQTDGRLICWVCASADGLVGTASIIVFDRLPSLSNPAGREGYVSNVYVDPAGRRQGIAKALLNALVADAREAGIGRAWLYANDQGLPLYERAGFAVKHRSECEMELPLLLPPARATV